MRVMNFNKPRACVFLLLQALVLSTPLVLGHSAVVAADANRGPATPVVVGPAAPAGPLLQQSPAAAQPLPAIMQPSASPPPAGTVNNFGNPGIEADTAVTISADSRLDRARILVEAGVRLENGEGIERDISKALALYCDAAKTELGDAFIRIGWLYANGRGVPRSEAIAATMFHRAARAGNEMGERLAELYVGQPRRQPPCLGGDAIADDAPPVPKLAAAAAAARLATPIVEAPAQFKTAAQTVERKKVLDVVIKFAKQLRLDPRLVMAVIGTESGFDPLARSVKNAQGLMQLIPDTAERFAVKDILDPVENLRGGMSYLRWLLAYYKGDVWLAVAAYNAGEGAVDRFRGVPPYAETMAYVQKIRNQYPLDWHPFDASATTPSAIFSTRRIGPTTLAPQSLLPVSEPLPALPRPQLAQHNLQQASEQQLQKQVQQILLPSSARRVTRGS